MKRILSAIFSIAFLAACNARCDYTRFVDPYIGTAAHGHVFVGASVPFGAVQVGPTSVPRDWDWCSGYHVSDSTVIGFAHTHIGGTGVGDLCDINVLPVVGTDIEYNRAGIADKADRTREVCDPTYYSVPLLKSGVKCEMTATDHVSFIRFAFPKKADDKAIIFNLQDGGNTDSPDVQSAICIIDSTHFVGYRYSHGWAKNQQIYFAAEFSKPFISKSQHEMNYYRFDFDDSEVDVKVSISPTASTMALITLYKELPGWDFDATREAARAAWNEELSKIDISGCTKDQRTVFYTSFYHSMIDPAHFNDYGTEPEYTVLSLWDTYRAWAPLFTIIHPEKESGFINTFLKIFDNQGKLPVWHLYGNETDCMIGTPAIPIVADAVLKGFEGIDYERAYKAMKSTAMNPERNQNFRIEGDYIPSDLCDFAPVAFDLEYCLSDWALAQAALKLGYQEDYEYFLRRSKTYKVHFDPKTGHMRGVNTDGSFTEPFSPSYSNHTHSDYCEGNGWQYTFLVPHDYEGLCECFSHYEGYTGDDTTGREALIQKLDSLFIVSPEIEGENASMDITGLIGQYAHGNEPSHHTVYLYCYAGEPWKTADLTRRICDELYTTAPDGICGNEDCGQMSAWYILTAMGFYQIEPAGGRYFFGSPLFKEMKLRLPEGRSLDIIARNNSDKNRYIQSITLNGEPLRQAWIDYADLMAGGELVYEMGSEPALWY
ncbi:MAG: GH92 family glycosyl hydrolase [Bacteroidales bacterium]|nr:GH92 family glycosyl hydrolase [Bacteroidales bacterium]